MSLAGQWNALNGEVLRYTTIQASIDHDHRIKRCLISNVKPVEQLTKPSIIFTSVAGYARGSIEHSL